MESVHVNLGQRSYDICIEKGILDRAGAHIRAVCPRARKLAVVTDETVEGLYAQRVLDSLEGAGFDTALFVGPVGEGAKCAQHLVALWEGMAHAGLTRTDAVVALGGGVVGDVAGFAAATYLRGVDFIQIPTTLLAQVDSSVGGKTAIDLEHGKNLAGAFWQPKLVLMDPDTLNTLSDKTFSDGMAEVIKYGCIANKGLFNFLLAHPSRPQVMERIEYVLTTCCDLKREAVEADERDTGMRMLLNFGHTVGHAYEKLGHYETWTHGQAVAAGMCVAARMGVAMGVTPQKGVVEFLTALCRDFGLPTAIPLGASGEEWEAGWQIVAQTVGLDKKSTGGDIQLILLDTLGAAHVEKLDKEEALAQLRAILEG